jgi:hypothetical protein
MQVVHWLMLVCGVLGCAGREESARATPTAWQRPAWPLAALTRHGDALRVAVDLPLHDDEPTPELVDAEAVLSAQLLLASASRSAVLVQPDGDWPWALELLAALPTPGDKTANLHGLKIVSTRTVSNPCMGAMQARRAIVELPMQSMDSRETALARLERDGMALAEVHWIGMAVALECRLETNRVTMDEAARDLHAWVGANAALAARFRHVTHGPVPSTNVRHESAKYRDALADLRLKSAQPCWAGFASLEQMDQLWCDLESGRSDAGRELCLALHSVGLVRFSALLADSLDR